ncbi:hypothetical protein [uncultured Litoreibacter sp.]|uniref:hypothetical protein n=1 Tax=uncultured Litoreibacter sp. TaxID=1392394 RepID=UPI00261946A4|nr:hypothetical protein [uncultured Litoreibacter sp.]
MKALSPNLAHIRTLLPPAHRNIGSTLKSLEGRARLRVTKFGDTENDRFLFRVLNAHVRFGPTAANQPKPSDVSYEPNVSIVAACLNFRFGPKMLDQVAGFSSVSKNHVF